ncbi:MAG: hypothetical protein PHF29_05645 [Candidatus Riflebacteria bacterium]|nr:hypothetical protein [Candidatus Riflebacteria bacterium]
MKRITFIAIALLLIVSCGAVVYGHSTTAPFMIRFVDEADGQPVPLVEIEAFNALRLVSDNLGYIAVQEPDLVGKKVRFLVRGNGYEYDKTDFFGEKSINPEVVPGRVLQIKLRRSMPAKRLYRITGAGRYRDSVLGGIIKPESAGGLPGKVVGLDSAIPVWWNNKLYCFWGDTLCTDRMNLSASGGIVRAAQKGDASAALDIEFFTNNEGYVKPMIDTGSPGFVWIEAVLPFKSGGGSEVLAARYVKHKTLDEAVETGFALFRPNTQNFSVIKKIKSQRHHKSAHAAAVSYMGRSGYAIQPWEMTLEGLAGFMNPDSYYAYTCLQPAKANEGVEIDKMRYSVNRDETGKVRYGWVRGGLACNPRLQTKLCDMKVLKQDEKWLFLTNIETGKETVDFNGSINWNPYRQRWIMIAQGETGEILYSEADTFNGPWIYARSVVKHDSYNFYNPVHHLWFDKDNGSKVFFEGTYTSFFTRDGYKTPRADYNQVMYSLDISRPELILPEPIYCVNDERGGRRLMNGAAVKAQDMYNRVSHIEFCAFSSNRGFEKILKPVYDHSQPNSDKFDLQTLSNGGEPLFYAVADDSEGDELAISKKLLRTMSFGKVIKAKGAVTLSPDISAELFK